MANLAEAVDAAETDWLVSADIPDTVDYLTVESEVVQVTATFPAQYQAADGSTSAPRIRVVRAAGGTTAASHADATALTPLIPPAAGGGAAAEGTVVEQLTGTQTEHGHLYRGDEDPEVDFGAELESGDLWLDTTLAAAGFPVMQKIRNEANDGWTPAALIVDVGGTAAYLAIDPDGALRYTGPGPAQSLFTIAADGTIELKQADGALGLNIAADGSGSLDIGVNGTIILFSPSGDTVIGNPLGGVNIDPAGNILLNGPALTFGGAPIGTQAAFVANGSTVDQLRDALIASGLMAAS